MSSDDFVIDYPDVSYNEFFDGNMQILKLGYTGLPITKEACCLTSAPVGHLIYKLGWFEDGTDDDYSNMTKPKLIRMKPTTPTVSLRAVLLRLKDGIYIFAFTREEQIRPGLVKGQPIVPIAKNIKCEKLYDIKQ